METSGKPVSGDQIPVRARVKPLLRSRYTRKLRWRLTPEKFGGLLPRGGPPSPEKVPWHGSRRNFPSED